MTHYSYQCSKNLLVFLFINYNSNRNNIPENEKKSCNKCLCSDPAY